MATLEFGPDEEAIYLRGLFLHRYTAGEHSVNVLLVRAAGLSEYEEYAPLSRQWPKRLKALGSMLRADGPLQYLAASLLEPVAMLTAHERYRHIMAHALMVVKERDGHPLVVFDGHEWIDKDLGQIGWELSLDDLRRAADDILEPVQAIVSTVRQAVRDVPLPMIEIEARIELQPKPREF